MSDAILGRLMLAFDGHELPTAMRRRLTDAPAAGVTLFRYRNVRSIAQVRALADVIQSCASPEEPFLIAIDQEGGQLRGLGPDSTPYPGNMALGAVDDPALTKRVGTAIGHELRAAGITVNYAPVADLATDRSNPSLGIRSFGDDPGRVSAHVVAMVEGLESAGVASALKHFPGTGAAGLDPHHRLARVDRSAAQLAARELVPFVAGMGAGASLVMAGHVAFPAIGGDRPATLSPALARDLLRRQLGFDGVSITDAFDMDALSAGDGRYDDAIDALDAGLDLLLLGGRSSVPAFDTALRAAAERDRPAAAQTSEALLRIRALRRRLGRWDPGYVSPDEPAALAREVAERSVTLVRDRVGLVPLRVGAGERILLVMPRAADLTPADTSAVEPVPLSAAVRRRHAATDELVVSPTPTVAEIAAARAAAAHADLVIVGTISASLEPAQVALVDAILEVGRPTITVALRTPWDLATYPAAPTHLCTYSLTAPSCEAFVAVCFGELQPVGRLPVVT